MNVMRTIRIEKLNLNIGSGKEQNKLEKGMTLLKNITGIAPIKTITQKRIPGWGLRPGLPIGCKITIRNEKVKPLLKRLLEAKDNKLGLNNFDDHGNISFGIHEYIDIPEVKYDPKVGIIGLQVCVTLERPGYRIKKRRLQNRKIRSKHKITRDEAIEFLQKEFGIKVEQ